MNLITWINFFFLNGPFPASFFFIFCLYNTQLTVYNNCSLLLNFCRWLDSNRGPLELEGTALPTEPQPLPKLNYFYYTSLSLIDWNFKDINFWKFIFRFLLKFELKAKLLKWPKLPKRVIWTFKKFCLINILPNNNILLLGASTFAWNLI